ncbi:MAG: hypothetical protein Q7Q71_05920 [Verrucomicrobiota bacterium JB023]|nr:hypothetical protein [Verrucomicrobiota bacterium JB023]
MPPPPQELFRQFEKGEISREELQAVCALHQREMLEEIEEVRRNPIGAYLEDLLLKREAAKLRREYGEGLIRDVFIALADVPDFPPAILIWNAGHRDVPLHSFFRLRREPVFRVLDIKNEGLHVKAKVEYGARERKNATREEFTLHRGARNELIVSSRKTLK